MTAKGCLFHCGVLASRPSLLRVYYRILKGGWFQGEGTRGPWGTSGKLREFKGIMGLLGYLPPLEHPPKDILSSVKS